MSEEILDAQKVAGSKVREVAAKAVADATFEALAKKPRRVLNFTVFTADDAGDQVSLAMKYQALSSKAYDDLIAAHPPTNKEKLAGASYNADTFSPALIAAVSLVPKLSYEQAREIYTSESWAGGELTALFINALRVCNAGLDVPFNESD